MWVEYLTRVLNIQPTYLPMFEIYYHTSSRCVIRANHIDCLLIAYCLPNSTTCRKVKIALMYENKQFSYIILRFTVVVPPLPYPEQTTHEQKTATKQHANIIYIYMYVYIFYIQMYPSICHVYVSVYVNTQVARVPTLLHSRTGRM